MQGTQVQSLVREWRSHMLRSNEAHRPWLKSPCATTEIRLPKLRPKAAKWQQINEQIHRISLFKKSIKRRMHFRWQMRENWRDQCLFWKSISAKILGEITYGLLSRKTHEWERTYPQDFWLSPQEFQQRTMRSIGKCSQYSFICLYVDDMGWSFDLRWWFHDSMAKLYEKKWVSKHCSQNHGLPSIAQGVLGSESLAITQH